jgi:tRNA nucleotidyltransferase (CCA-adding enzyme)
MARKFDAAIAALAQTHPSLAIIRMAALLAEAEDEPDDDALDDLLGQVEPGFLLHVHPNDVWPELARGLMARSPSRMVRALSACGALSQIVPETAALFGVPQIADEAAPVDIGAHLLRAIDEAANCGAPLAVRFALLVMNVGKADSPPEHLPSHYKHIERGIPRIRGICDRLSAPDEMQELALLALAECERIHRVSPARAGPIALMLDRLGAFDGTEAFELLMIVCACDYRAFGDRSGQDYPKAALLNAAIQTCAGMEEVGLEGEALQVARAKAIARALRSQRWSED